MVGDDVVERMARAVARKRLEAHHGCALPNYPIKVGSVEMEEMRAALAALGPEYVLVPREPTEDMVLEGCEGWWRDDSVIPNGTRCREAYKAMLSAAPSLPHEDGGNG